MGPQAVARSEFRWAASCLTWHCILASGFWLLVVASAAINPCWFFCADWIPKYMHDQRGFSFAWAGAVTLPVFLFADAGNFFGGGLVKLLTGRGWSIRKARGTAATIGAVLILSAPLVGYVENAFLCIALLVVAAFGITTLMVNYAACVQEVSFLSVGLVSGVLGAFGNLVAATLNPLIGKHVDTTGNYHVIFVLLGVWPLTALVAILTFDAVAARRERITD